MTLPKFVFGMVIVIIIVSIWSYLDAASWGMILLRGVICAVILQVGYFLVVLAMVLRGAPKPGQAKDAGKPSAGTASVVPGDDLTPKGSSH